jgi:HTH-type transcriptional regulator/antitoxin HipB
MPTQAEDIPLSSPAEIGSLIRRQRKALGLTQHGVAGLTGYSIAFVNAVENGKPTAEIGRVMGLMSSLGIDLFGRPR